MIPSRAFSFSTITSNNTNSAPSNRLPIGSTEQHAYLSLCVDLILSEKVSADAAAPLGVPVTLKTRTGWDRDSRNALRVAKLAENAGIAALTLHGRTRADLYTGEAEYDTIRAVKAELTIPVIANGDIDSPEKAKHVLDYTGADAVMIGRAAQGRPWIFREVVHFLQTGEHLASPSTGDVRDILLEHVRGLHQLYGEVLGPRIARKHVGWYLAEHDAEGAFRSEFNGIEQQQTQLDALWNYFEQLAAT